MNYALNTPSDTLCTYSSRVGTLATYPLHLVSYCMVNGDAYNGCGGAAPKCVLISNYMMVKSTKIGRIGAFYTSSEGNWPMD